MMHLRNNWIPDISTMIANKTTDLILQTPLIRLDKIIGGVNLFGKLESVQPGGSVKDRAALEIIKNAYATGDLETGKPVVEMTSGNMGAGLAIVCRQTGNPFTAVMSVGNSPERARILKALGAEVIFTPQVDGEQGMVTGQDIRYAAEIAISYAKEKGAYYVDQFNNPASVIAHFNTTGPEIWKELPEIEAFVAAVGSGGTFTGTSSYLKTRSPGIRCVAVEPENASILKTGKINNSKHIIQGTGYGFVPPHWDPLLADDIVLVSDSEVREMTIRLSRDQGLFVGYSSGANVVAALKYARLHPGIQNIVTVLCDTGHKYSDL
jgi:cysteine synthase A